jgi:2-dehydro-3-deoxy-D-arabinonate dehydratase
MYLSRHLTPDGPKWALDGHLLPSNFSLGLFLQLSPDAGRALLDGLRTDSVAYGPLLAPIEPAQEVWAAGVTYLRSRDARMEESETPDHYDRVYVAERPELFAKAAPGRIRGPDEDICIRGDSTWDVPEPELTVVADASGEVVAYTIGDDVSSRSIEGDNPLYLPQAKVYRGSGAVGPARGPR